MPDDYGRIMLVYGTEVDRGLIGTFFTEEVDKALWFYGMYKQFGFAHPGGWGDQPAWQIDILRTLKAEEAKRKPKDGS